MSIFDILWILIMYICMFQFHTSLNVIKPVDMDWPVFKALMSRRTGVYLNVKLNSNLYSAEYKNTRDIIVFQKNW